MPPQVNICAGSFWLSFGLTGPFGPLSLGCRVGCEVSPMKVLVAGAGGYIGIPLCQALLDGGHDVVALDRYFFGKEKMAALAAEPGLTILTDDIRAFDPEHLNSVDAVIDLAGLSNDLSADIDPDVTQSINCEGAMRLARLSKEAGVRRYVYSSSASVYGDARELASAKRASVGPSRFTPNASSVWRSTLQALHHLSSRR